VRVLTRVMNGFRALFRKSRVEDELDAELRAFLETAVDQKMRAGMSREEATRAARMEFGSFEAVKDGVRDVGWESVVETFWQDLRYAGRMLRKSPGFTTAAVLTLALGIGATTAIFSFVNGVVLRPLPFKESARLVQVQPDPRESGLFQIRTVTPADFLEWQLQNHVFDEMAGFSGATFSLTGAGEPERLQAATVTTRFLDTLGVMPVLGRTFLRSEGQPGTNQVVIISSTLWRRRFQSDPGIVGRPIALDGKSFTVVGVMPEGFGFPQDLLPGMGKSRPVELWTPLVLRPGDRSNAFLQVIARLRPDVTIEQAQAQMEAIAARLAEQVPPDRRIEGGVRIMTLHERVVRGVRPLLLVFLEAVGFLLVIACSNVANLLVARGVARQKEVAVRAALGAGRSRLVRQFLTESLLLGLLGGLGGLLVAVQGVAVLTSLIPPGSLPRIQETGIDGQALAFTIMISFVTGVFFGLAPAFRSSRTDISSAIKELGATQTPRSRVLNLLVVGEVALAFVLLTGAGLMINSFWRLTSVDPGFEPERILTVSVTLPEGGYDTSSEMRAFSTDVLNRLRGAPGVARAAAINSLPLRGSIMGGFSVEGIPQLPRGGSWVSKPVVSPEYFQTMGIPVVRGRAFTDRDAEQAPGVAIVTDRLARLLWPGADPIGKRLKIGFGRPEEQPWLSVVGVVGEVKQTALAEEMPPAVYVPLLQAPRPFLLRDLTFVVRTAVPDPLSVAPILRREIRNVDPNLPFDRIQTMRDVLGDSVAEPRFRSAVLGAFAGTAVALVATGILGILAYSVTRRTREIGVRMALGAQRGGVLRLVIAQALRMMVAGLAVGLIAALALTRLLSNFLFDVRPTDPATFVAASLVLVGAALIASYLPARRAATIDPLIALRSE
jgi:predicted permease